MNKPIEYVKLKINIQQAMRRIDDAEKKGNFEQAQCETLEVLVNARLLYQAYGSWIKDHAEELS